MNDLAEKLITLERREAGSSNLPTAIFGTTGTLAQHLDTRRRIRIGMWPIINSESPELAMGLASVLASLLEHWQDIRVYRLFVKLEGAPEEYEWSSSDSQFDVDDWQLEQLDENVAIWGTLETSDTTWKLSLNIENDLTDGEETEIVHEATDIRDLVNQLPKVAADIAGTVDATETDFDAYQMAEADLEQVEILLKRLFRWQVDLLLSLWGKTWSDEEFENDIDGLLAAGREARGDFGAWCVTSAITHAMLPGYGDVAEQAASRAADVFSHFPDAEFPAIYISHALYRLGYIQQAHDLLESAVEINPGHSGTWLALANLYGRGGRVTDAVDTYQRVIEAEAADARLYAQYAGLLSNIDPDLWSIDEFVLIDPDDYESKYMIWEAIEGYQQAFQHDPAQMRALQQKILLLIEMGETKDQLWQDFEKLVVKDKTGDAVRSVVDALYDLDEDSEPATHILEKYTRQEPDRTDLHINLAVAYLNLEERDSAHRELEKAEETTDDSEVLTDIQRLLLTADDPEFEIRLGEIGSIASAGNPLSVEDVDFLEDAIETAPTLAEAYVLLAKAYVAWDEDEAALETLLDGHAQNPDDPDILEMLVRVLWESGAQALAFDYLNKGTANSPNHVPLLALTGQYLFEDGQEAAAKAYLARAEAIAPRHPALAEARANISQTISRRD